MGTHEAPGLGPSPRLSPDHTTRHRLFVKSLQQRAPAPQCAAPTCPAPLAPPPGQQAGSGRCSKLSGLAAAELPRSSSPSGQAGNPLPAAVTATMPSTLPPARMLRALLHTPATTNQEAQAIVQAVHTVAATCRAQADGGDMTPAKHTPLLLQ